MKIIIDIPERTYKDLQRRGSVISLSGFEAAVATGKPIKSDEVAIEALRESREKAWGFDIPSPCCPEYQELHEEMQEIMRLCASWIQVLKKGGDEK